MERHSEIWGPPEVSRLFCQQSLLTSWDHETRGSQAGLRRSRHWGEAQTHVHSQKRLWIP